jgi:hypothetical protein
MIQTNDLLYAKLTFATPEARDQFLDAVFPERRCSDIPGVFNVSGGVIGVRFETVTFTAPGALDND